MNTTNTAFYFIALSILVSQVLAGATFKNYTGLDCTGDFNVTKVDFNIDCNSLNDNVWAKVLSCSDTQFTYQFYSESTCSVPLGVQLTYASETCLNLTSNSVSAKCHHRAESESGASQVSMAGALILALFTAI